MKIQPIFRKCHHCQIDFEIKYHCNLDKKFCSRSCSVSDKNKNRVWKQSSKNKISKLNTARLLGIKNPNYKGGGVDCICQQCKQSFKVPVCNINSKKHGGKFCSKSCSYDYVRDIKLSSSQRILNKYIARNLSRLLKQTTPTTSNKWLVFLGYTVQELKTHIEKQFTTGMTWKNHGDWHIDHKKPMSYFNFDKDNKEELKLCWALSNLQPLWKNDNLSKGGSNTHVNIKKYGRKIKQ